MIEYVILSSDKVMQSNHMPFRHPQGPVPAWPSNRHDILNDGPFMLCCKEKSVIAVLQIPEPLEGMVSNGSSFGLGRIYRSAWQWPYPIKNRSLFKRTITLRPQILIREFSVWYVKYAAQHVASFGGLRFSISLNLCKR